MALPATLRRFSIALADSDREVYEQLDWRVPQHPSESERYLIARLLARALEHAEGVEFSKGGVSDDEEPAIIQRDLTGVLKAWIEVGAPSPDRLHKASKAAKRVVVYAWKNVEQLAADIAERKIHRADDLVIRALPADLLDAVAATLDRNNTWELAVSGGTIYLTIGGASFEVRSSRSRCPESGRPVSDGSRTPMRCGSTSWAVTRPERPPSAGTSAAATSSR